LFIGCEAQDLTALATVALSAISRQWGSKKALQSFVIERLTFLGSGRS
jgi:hypothetical protein